MNDEREHKKYDTQHELTFHNARIAQEPNPPKNGLFKFTVVATSSNAEDEDMWIDVVVQDHDVPTASYLRKGDVLSVRGLLTMKHWGDKNMLSFTLKFPKIYYPISLVQELNNRRGGNVGAAPAERGNGAGKSRRRDLPF